MLKKYFYPLTILLTITACNSSKNINTGAGGNTSTSSSDTGVVMGTGSLAANAATVGMGAPQMILPKLHALNQAEVKAAKLGESKACRAEVKRFAKMMAEDHETMDGKVSAMMTENKVDPANLQLNDWEKENIQAQSSAMDQLSSISDCTFDDGFVGAMVAAHQFAIQMVTNARNDSANTSLAVFLDATLSKLEAHLSSAKELMATGQNKDKKP